MEIVFYTATITKLDGTKTVTTFPSQSFMGSWLSFREMEDVASITFTPERV